MKATNFRQTYATDLASPLLRRAIALISGATCHACFVLGVGTMVVAMYFGMSRSLGALEAPWSWIANASLLVQFPIAHSFLLTNRGRALLAGLAPAGIGSTLSSTTYVTIASLQIFALFALWSASGTIWWQADGAVLAILTALYAVSWLLLGKAMADAGLALQTGSLGWIALLRNKPRRLPKNASERAISTFTPTDLCHVHSDAVDCPNLDPGPARHCRCPNALLPYRTAL